MIDCPHCANLSEQLRIREKQISDLRGELDRRDTVAVPPPEPEIIDDLPSPVEAYLAQCERVTDADDLLQIAAQEGP